MSDPACILGKDLPPEVVAELDYAINQPLDGLLRHVGLLPEQIDNKADGLRMLVVERMKKQRDELLEACEAIHKALVQRIGGLPDSTFTDPYFKLRVAIAKAKGQA